MPGGFPSHVCAWPCPMGMAPQAVTHLASNAGPPNPTPIQAHVVHCMHQPLLAACCPASSQQWICVQKLCTSVNHQGVCAKDNLTPCMLPLHTPARHSTPQLNPSSPLPSCCLLPATPQERNTRTAGTPTPAGNGTLRPRVHFFSTFFWNKLYQDKGQYDYKEVRVRTQQAIGVLAGLMFACPAYLTQSGF